jgi:hypothetical protein
MTAVKVPLAPSDTVTGFPIGMKCVRGLPTSAVCAISDAMSLALGTPSAAVGGTAVDAGGVAVVDAAGAALVEELARGRGFDRSLRVSAMAVIVTAAMMTSAIAVGTTQPR